MYAEIVYISFLVIVYLNGQILYRILIEGLYKF